MTLPLPTTNERALLSFIRETDRPLSWERIQAEAEACGVDRDPVSLRLWLALQLNLRAVQ